MKNKNVIRFFFICVVLFFSCSKRPGVVLPEDKMIDLMADMEIAEAYVNTQMGGSAKERVDVGKKVLELHGVSEETLDTTLAWYGRNMDDYAKLFEKVDKEIEDRRKHYSSLSGTTAKKSGNLWQSGPHHVLSPLSGYNSFSFSLPNPEMEKGDLIQWSMFFPNSVSLKCTLGVEYTDGSGEAAIVNSNSKNKIEVEVQSDTARTVARIFGMLNLKESVKQNIFIDSLSIITEEIDTLLYLSKRRAQKTFAARREFSKPVKEEIKDSLKKEETAPALERETNKEGYKSTLKESTQNEVSRKSEIDSENKTLRKPKFEKLRNNN